MRDEYLRIPRDPVIRKIGMFAQFPDVPYGAWTNARVLAAAPSLAMIGSSTARIRRGCHVQGMLARIFHACPHNNRRLLTSLSQLSGGLSAGNLAATKAISSRIARSELFRVADYERSSFDHDATRSSPRIICALNPARCD
jgi:hypothetical protein